MRPRSMPLLALLPLLLSLSVQAGVYRWVDADGQVHYGDQPPPHAEAVRTPGGGDAAGDAASGRLPEGDGEEASRQAACSDARKRLQSYQEAGEITETNALGETREYTPEEIAELLARQQAVVDEVCDGR